MANRLGMALSEAIFSLHQRGWSRRRIARELGVDRATVARYLEPRHADSNAANAPIGSNDPGADSNAANAPIGSCENMGDPDDGRSSAVSEDFSCTAENGSRLPNVPLPGRSSGCEPWRAVIEAKIALGLSAQRVYQDLVAEHGYTGSYYSVRRFARRLDHVTPLPFRRMECEPGGEAQVDFGTGAPLVGHDGKKRRTHVIRVVLSHSRKAYSEVVTRQTTEDFIRCLENAWVHFGGVPRRLVLDNLRAAVTRADWFDPEINPKVQSFGAHYGLIFLPTRPYTPRHKGKVERGVAYVQDNALKGRRFSSLEEQNQFLQDWERTVADTRLHGTTRRQVGGYFLEAERPALQPLPQERFAFFHEARRSVHRDGHIEVDRAFYSVPPEYLARRVWVRWDARMVRIFNDRMEKIAVHARREPGRFSTQSPHIASEKISGVERGSAWLLGRVRRIGANAVAWSEATIQTRGVEGVRVIQGLLALVNRHSAAEIDRACEIAASYGSYRLRTVRALIDRQPRQQELLNFLTEHPLIRSLSEYENLVHSSFQKES